MAKAQRAAGCRKEMPMMVVFFGIDLDSPFSRMSFIRSSSIRSRSKYRL